MNLSDVKNWIITKSTADDMDAIRRFMKTREEILASEISEGDTVRIHDISPKYLNGLTGKFDARREGRGKSRGAVVLDEASTKVIALKGHGRFFVPPGAKEFRVGGIPMTCLSKV